MAPTQSPLAPATKHKSTSGQTSLAALVLLQVGSCREVESQNNTQQSKLEKKARLQFTFPVVSSTVQLMRGWTAQNEISHALFNS